MYFYCVGLYLKLYVKFLHPVVVRMSSPTIQGFILEVKSSGISTQDLKEMLFYSN